MREVAAQRAEERAEPMRRALAAALEKVYPGDGYNNPSSWPRCASLTPHLFSICQTEMGDAAANARRAVLLDRAGDYFHGRAAYVEARSLLERALAIRESLYGPMHTDTAVSLNNLAMLLKDQGDLAEALPLYERALAIEEKVLGLDHPETAGSLNNLAMLLQAQGDFVGAQPLLERVLTIREKSFGPEHPNTARSVNNLAGLLMSQGNLAGAQLQNKRALAIREKVLGPEHPDTALGLNNLAGLLSWMGGGDNYGALFKRAIAIGEIALGREHPLTQRFCNSYARHLLGTGRAAEALPLAQAALATHEAASHAYTKDSARVAADALDALGRAAEAGALRSRYKIANEDAAA